MKPVDVVGAKALTTPTVCKHLDFLDNFCEPTIEMIDWYYRTPSVDTIQVRDVDDHTTVIEITEYFNDSQIHRSFTIGRSTKALICKDYLHYHPMKTWGDTNS